jgi:hypothetical protein
MTKKFAKEHQEEGRGKMIGGRKDMEKGLRQDKRWNMNTKEGKEGEKK